MSEHLLGSPTSSTQSRTCPFTKKFLIYICAFSVVTYICISDNWNVAGRVFNLNSRFRRQFNLSEIRDYKKYRIDTKNCKINDLPIFDQETRRLFKNPSETRYDCKDKTHKRIKISRINETIIQLNWTAVGYMPLCYYRELKRGKDDLDNKYGQFVGPISKPKIDLPDYFFVHIVCYNKYHNESNFERNKFNKKDPNLIHDEIIPLIPFVNKTSDSSLPNVLLLAIDATSYVNFKRHFIRTEKLLNQKKFFELRGYNKVGANTFPNMIPFLTGHHSKELVTDSELKNIHFDDWPLIWKDYSKKGFVTTFVEEMTLYGLFNFELKGFISRPTDYQTRPFHMEIKEKKYNKFCYLGQTETQLSLDWTLDFIRAENKRKQKYFAYISICEMTHDWIEAGHYLDVPYFEFLNTLFNENLLNDTLLIFFSDHGFRYGPLRQTHTGEVENRLPFIFIHLPQNFNDNYTEILRQNQYRLTTAFDIHATLSHLIQGKPNYTLPHGLSLFDKVMDESRDCNSSSIPDMYCSCYDDIEINDFDIIKPEKTLPKIVAKINSFIANVSSKCAEYEIESIHKLYERSFSRTDSEFKLGDSRIFILQLYVNPGMALFETVIRSFKRQTNFEIIGEITRINRYGDQAHCLNDKLLKNYCFCKDLLK